VNDQTRDPIMKYLLPVAAVAAFLSLAAAEAPKPAPKPAPTYHDVVFFADSRPILLRLHITLDGKPVSALWDAFVDRVFSSLDTGGKGYLDKAEAARLPAPAALFGGGVNGGVPPFNQLDLNGDGKVTKNELAAWYRRNGAMAFQAEGAGAGRSETQVLQAFLLADLGDLDGTVRLWDAAGGRRGDDVNDALFKLLDTNHDGKLSKEELAAAAEVLLKRDRNEDEIITRDEISGRGAPAQYVLNEVVFATDSFSIGRARGISGPFHVISTDESTTELARALQRYLPKSTGKKSQSQKIGRKELGLDEETFKLLDADGDGYLDFEELQRFANRPPDLELKVEIGKTPSVELVKRGAPLEKSVRRSRTGVLMLELGETRIDLKALATGKSDAGAADSAKQLRAQYLQAFKAADVDKNGYLDMSEAMRSPLYRNVFKIMDRDGDGKLFEKEVIAYLDTYQDLLAAVRTSCASVSMTEEGKGLFELLDTNGDGRLSVREMRNAIKLLEELDHDGKGFLTKTDIPRCSTATFRTGPAAPVNLNGGYTTAAIAFSPDGEWLAASGQPPRQAPRGPAWFVKMDRNGDGDVSRKEFLGTDEQFKEIDTDGDGLISVEEAEAYDRKVRGKKK
jgi:Ca2+-binding EF-hand superfamily protein